MNGKVFLVGAGPGDPELLTLKAARLLREAEIVLHDDLVSAEVLALVPSAAQVLNVGKRCGQKSMRQEEIHFLMIAAASQGLRVLRLKSGDPLIFGRAGEEIAALRKAGIDFEIVPGVTAALGAASAAQIPLTHRQFASAVVFVTGHEAAGGDKTDLRALVRSGATLMFYMPGRDYGEIRRRLISSGLDAETPCALISRASQPDQSVHVTTLNHLPDVPRAAAPSLLVVGPVVQLAHPSFSKRQVAVWARSVEQELQRLTAEQREGDLG
jgi:uroporphyrin-III C-methyltransferase